MKIRDGDAVMWLIFSERVAQADEWLRQKGWAPSPGETADGEEN